MKKTIAIVLVVLIAACAVFGQAATESAYPNQTINFIVPFPASGAMSVIVHALLENMELPVAYTVDNIVGGSGTIGLAEAYNRDADGYTVALISNSFVTNPLTNSTIPFTIDDFVPLTYIASPVLACLCCNPSIATDADAFLAYLKTCDSISIGTTSMTGFSFVAGADLFMQMGIYDKVKWVAYEGSGELLQSYLSGEIDAAIIEDNNVHDYINQGSSITVAMVLASERSYFFPEVAAASEFGFSDLEKNVGFKGIAVKKGTPQEAIDYIYAKFAEAVVSPEFQEWCINRNFVPITKPITSEDFTKIIHMVSEASEEIFKKVGLI